jgi:hypothetical protein
MTNEENPQTDQHKASTSPPGETKDATSPPGNPETDQDAVERGEENIEKISGN